MMKRRQISVENGPKALGPYSTAIQVGRFLYVSGQLPLDDASLLVEGDIGVQTRCVIENLEKVLQAADMVLEDVVSTTVYLCDLQDYDKMNQMFAIYFSHPYPARSCVGVQQLPKEARIQIDVVAIQSEAKDFDDSIQDDCGGCCG